MSEEDIKKVYKIEEKKKKVKSYKTKVLFRGLATIDDDGTSELVLELTYNDVVVRISDKMWNWIISILKNRVLQECRVNENIVYEKIRIIEKALKEDIY